MKTINEKAGYKFSNGTSGKRWVRGHTMYSTGKKYTGNGPESIPCIVKTNLDTGEIQVASLVEHKRFMTEDAYKAFLLNEFVALSKLGQCIQYKIN